MNSLDLTVRLEEGKTAEAARELLAKATPAEWCLAVEWALAVVLLEEQRAAAVFLLDSPAAVAAAAGKVAPETAVAVVREGSSRVAAALPRRFPAKVG
jgi:hypothetical protein